jgi:hypothetical protein
MEKVSGQPTPVSSTSIYSTPASYDPISPVFSSLEDAFGLSGDAINSRLIGIATFDIHGMLESQFLDPRLRQIDWSDLILKAVGLQSLLRCCFQMQPSHRMFIRNTDCDMLVSNEKTRHVVLFLSKA